MKGYVQNHAVLQEAILANESYIKSETLTEELLFAESLENGTEIEFDDIKSKLIITK